MSFAIHQCLLLCSYFHLHNWEFNLVFWNTVTRKVKLWLYVTTASPFQNLKFIALFAQYSNTIMLNFSFWKIFVFDNSSVKCIVQNIWKIRLQLTKPVTWPPLVWGVVCGAAASGTKPLRNMHVIKCLVLRITTTIV